MATIQRIVRPASRAAARALTTSVRPHIAPCMGSSILPLAYPNPNPTPSSTRFYHEKVLDHYSSPRNVGSLPKNAQNIGTGLVGAPACGDVMKLQIRVNKDDKTGEDRIEEVKFKTFGCGSAIASSSYLTELVQGMTLEEAGKVRNTEIARELCLPPVKLHCSMLAEDAIKSAISNYYTKNPKAKATDLGGTSAPMPKVEIEQVMNSPPAGQVGVAA